MKQYTNYIVILKGYIMHVHNLLLELCSDLFVDNCSVVLISAQLNLCETVRITFDKSVNIATFISAEITAIPVNTFLPVSFAE